jgi:hypothetical protein
MSQTHLHSKGAGSHDHLTEGSGSHSSSHGVTVGAQSLPLAGLSSQHLQLDDHPHPSKRSRPHRGSHDDPMAHDGHGGLSLGQNDSEFDNQQLKIGLGGKHEDEALHGTSSVSVGLSSSDPVAGVPDLLASVAAAVAAATKNMESSSAGEDAAAAAAAAVAGLPVLSMGVSSHGDDLGDFSGRGRFHRPSALQPSAMSASLPVHHDDEQDFVETPSDQGERGKLPPRFPCEICGLRFSSTTYRNHHRERVHGNEAAFACPECDKRFSSRSNLNKHIRVIHKGDKGNACPICRRMYSTSAYLLRHLISAHNITKPLFRCGCCEASFGTPAKLRRHQLAQHRLVSPDRTVLIDATTGELAGQGLLSTEEEKESAAMAVRTAAVRAESVSRRRRRNGDSDDSSSRKDDFGSGASSMASLGLMTSQPAASHQYLHQYQPPPLATSVMSSSLTADISAAAAAAAAAAVANDAGHDHSILLDFPSDHYGASSSYMHAIASAGISTAPHTSSSGTQSVDTLLPSSSNYYSNVSMGGGLASHNSLDAVMPPVSSSQVEDEVVSAALAAAEAIALGEHRRHSKAGRSGGKAQQSGQLSTSTSPETSPGRLDGPEMDDAEGSAADAFADAIFLRAARGVLRDSTAGDRNDVSN